MSANGSPGPQPGAPPAVLLIRLAVGGAFLAAVGAGPLSLDWRRRGSR